MSITHHPRQSCPACGNSYAASTKMFEHLSRFCCVVKAFKKANTPETINAKIFEYFNTYKFRKSSDVPCQCVLEKTYFCERIVRLIDWSKGMTYVQVSLGRQHRGYFRY